MADVSEPFVWGRGGQRLTPQQIDRQRKVAEAMMAKGSDYSPIGHWTQGLARVSSSIVGALQQRDLDAQERAGLSEQAGRNAILAGAEPTSFGDAPAAMVPSAPSMAGDGAARTMAMPNVSPEIKDGLAASADALGVTPVDLATAVSYETAGTFDPTKAGPTTKWGQHRGLIQFGEPQAKQHGVDWSNPVGSQLGANGAIVSYLKTAGVKPGMGLLDIYSAINAGAPGLYDRSDAKAGGAPGTVRDKVEQQMQGHRAKAQALFRAAEADMPAPGAVPAELPGDAAGFALPQGGGDTPMPIMQEGGALPNFDPASGRWLGPTSQAPTFAEQGAPQGGPATPSYVEQGGPGAALAAQVQPPAFATQGTSQPWMGSAIDPTSQASPQVVRIAKALVPPSRPYDLAADLPASGASQAIGQLPASQPQPAMLPDLSNANDAGARQLQVVSEEQRRGQAAAPQDVASPLAGVVQALMGHQQPQAAYSSASPAVSKVAQAIDQRPMSASPSSAAAPSSPTERVASAMVSPAGQQSTRVRAAIATLNSPYAQPGDKAIAQSVLQQSFKSAEFETITRPDGSVFRVPKVGGQPVQVFGPQSKPEGPTGDMREYDLHVAQEKAAGRQPESFTDWARGNKASGRTAINIDTKGAGKFAEKANELQAKRYSDMVDGSDSARQMQGDLDMLEGMSKGLATGRGAETRLAMAQFAKAWGFDDIASGLTGGKLPEMEAFTSLIDKLTPQMRQGMPGAASDRDVSIFRNALPSMLKTPEGNQIVMQTLRAMNAYKMQAGDFAGQALRGEISQADADKGMKGLERPFAKFKEYRTAQDKAEAQTGAKAPPSASPPPAPEARKSLGGKSYVKRGAEWFEE
ncbi:hypothetical protein [Bosea sp. PAMC 26642]|uniref:hypothetical protein n=1 Tax=Bosea sp. (strain PAMC 26642) TaxID=1792307 RepID=UPI00076FFE01|nr:hypothetical protein [Bosea sp. PAMC 26642]AMJ61985.1 hypothetical protein AXW83_18265 [Bosea sp. PAMC 26642]